MPMGISDIYAAYEPVRRKYFGLGRKSVKTVYDKIAIKGKSDEAITEWTEYGGFGVLGLKRENARMQTDRIVQGWTKRHEGAIYAGACEMSYEAAKMARYKEIQRSASTLGRATELTPEYLWALFMDRGHDTAYPAVGDGLPIYSLVHTTPRGPTFKNTLTSPAALGPEGWEQVEIDLMGLVAEDGMPMPVEAEAIVVPKELGPLAWRMFNTTDGEIGTPNYGKSYMAGPGKVKIIVNRYLTNATRWHVVTSVTTQEKEGFFFDFIEEPTFKRENPWMTMQSVSIAFFWAMWGIRNARGAFSSNAT